MVRRDLRLTDNPVLGRAADSGRPVIPVFVLDEVIGSHGAAPKWRLGLGVSHFARRLGQIGSRLVLRRGTARTVLDGLVDETGAGAVWWTRAYDPASIERDESVKSALTGRGIDAGSVPGHILFEPWTVETGQGGYYKVFTPYWRAVKDRDVPRPTPAPSELRGPRPGPIPTGSRIGAWAPRWIAGPRWCGRG